MIETALLSSAKIVRILSSVSDGRFRNQALFALLRLDRIRLRCASSSAELCDTCEPGVYSRVRFFPFIVEEDCTGRNRLGRVVGSGGTTTEDALLCGKVCAAVVIAFTEEHILWLCLFACGWSAFYWIVPASECGHRSVAMCALATFLFEPHHSTASYSFHNSVERGA